MNIVFDAGHTGFDPGAVGQNGLKESDVVLKVCKFLREMFPEYNVLLTREEAFDASVDELYVRVQKAEEFGAQCFISIHCNSAENKSAEGFEVWIWPGDETSRPLAQKVIESFEKHFPNSDNRGVKEARFGVLKGEFPSILIELDFISNIEVEQKLGSKDFQKKYAQAIKEGFDQWNA